MRPRSEPTCHSAVVARDPRRDPSAMTQRIAATLGAVCLLVAVATVSIPGNEPRLVQAQATEAYRLVDTWFSNAGPRPAGFLRTPDGVAADSDGNVFVVDSHRGMVHVFRDGAWTNVWGSRGIGPGEMVDPHGITLMGDRLVVADTGNRRLHVFETDGELVDTWEGVGTPWDVAATSDRLLVSDYAGDRIFVLDYDGQRVDSLGQTGTEPGELQAPTGLTAWSDGRLAVVDSGNDRIQIWGSTGAVSTVITNTGARPYSDVAVLGDNNIIAAHGRWIRSYEHNMGVQVAVSSAAVPGTFFGVAATAYEPAVVTPTIWVSYVHDDKPGLRRYDCRDFGPPTDWLGLASPPGEFSSPSRITIEGDQALVADAWPRVQRLRTDGAPIDQIPVSLASDIAAVGSDIVASSGSSVRRMAGISTTWSWVPEGESVWFAGLAKETATDQLLVLDVNQQELHEVSPEGVRSAKHALWTPFDRDYRSYTDLAVRHDGMLYLVNRTDSELQLRARDGRLIEQWPVLGVPLRVAAAPTGEAFVLTREGWVWKLTSTGGVTSWWDVSADVSDTTSAPADVDVGPDGRVYVTDAAADRVLVYEQDPNAAPPNPPTGDGCTFVRDKWASPPRIRLGETVDVTLTVAGECLGEGVGVDVMLVVDRSGSMTGRKIDSARAAGIAFINEMNFDVSRVGLVVFNTEAIQPVGLETDAATVVEALIGFGDAIGGTDVGEGIQLAANALATTGRPNVPHVIVVMTDGRPESADVDADMAALAAKAQGVRLFSIGFGGDVDTALLKRVASTPDDYYFAPSTAELSGIYTEIARRLTGGIIAKTAVITDVVPSNMTYLVGSADPPVDDYTNKTLRWELSGVRGDIELTYRLRPQQVGTWPTNRDARMRYRDGLDKDGELVFPVPQVIVYDDGPPRPPEPLFLPLVELRKCLPRKQHADVVLLIDSSSTMTGEKHDAAKAAARLFVDRLDLPDDRAAVIGFSGYARPASGLTGDRVTLHEAINSLSIIPGTSIDAGLRAATGELTGDRARDGVTRVVVLLTDGWNNDGPNPVRAAAADGRSHGIQYYTVALGNGADTELLAEVANDPRRVFLALQPGDLDRIYTEIAGVIACP